MNRALPSLHGGSHETVVMYTAFNINSSVGAVVRTEPDQVYP